MVDLRPAQPPDAIGLQIGCSCQAPFLGLAITVELLQGRPLAQIVGLGSDDPFQRSDAAIGLGRSAEGDG